MPGEDIMFKLGLLTSTAMTAVTLLLSGAPAGALAQTNMHVASRDPNARFLCNYGQFLVSDFSSHSGSFYSSGWRQVAVPVIGHGQTVTQILVLEQFSASASASVGIYRASSGGFPGSLIAGNWFAGRSRCGRRTVSIRPTTLKANRKYWIEERAGHRGLEHIRAYWEANPKAKQKAYVQTHWLFSSVSRSSSTSPWTKQSMGPWFKLR